MSGRSLDSRVFVLAAALALAPEALAADDAAPGNPVIPGFHPDPSIVRVGDDYYVANSSFAYFPGVPIHHSRDLVHWRLIGNALTTTQQLPLPGAGLAAGIWAPTLRHHAGTFYLVTTNMTKGGNFFVTAKNPAGPWSPPVWIDRDGWDPDLFFDDDGRAYYTRAGGKGEGGRDAIVQAEIDVRTGKLRGPLAPVSYGSGGFGPEAPHVYKIGGRYYLLLAEGGTHAGHMVTLFRGPKPSGPFEPAPRNPILTQRDRLLERVQATGHGDLVQARDGAWWIVFLGIRNFASPMHMMHTLGRETFLVPVRWGDDGWPIVNDGQPIREQLTGAPVGPPHPWPSPPVRETFDARSLAPEWVVLRNPPAARMSLIDPPGTLTLHGAPESLDDARSAPALVARRQEHLRVRAATELSFEPKAEGDEAGMSVFYDENHHYDLAVVRRAGKRVVIVRRTSNDLRAEVATIAAPDGPVRLEIETNPWSYFFYLGTGAGRVQLAKARAAPISTEAAGGFTGTMLALYATGNGKPASAPARFAWFDYEPRPDEPPAPKRR